MATALAGAGVVAAQEEATELLAAAAGDAAALRGFLERRMAGEPLAWITGRTDFDGLVLRVDPGVYVPRWQSIELERRAAGRLGARGTAVDVCTGCGALALALLRARPGARVLGTDVDPRAVTCARANGVDAFHGDLFAPLPRELMGVVDVVVAVVPYVPTPDLAVLPRDTLAFEDAAHYDGGADGTELLRRVVAEAPAWLRPGGAVLLELGGDQADILRPVLETLGYREIAVWRDDDGDVRGVETSYGASA